ncbi:MAG: ABC transporter substrate-binding protein [Actinomycetota bacterium]|nr:ABC transporter substrate-binding protein [Actinomycetota bacterium]
MFRRDASPLPAARASTSPLPAARAGTPLSAARASTPLPAARARLLIVLLLTALVAAGCGGGGGGGGGTADEEPPEPRANAQDLRVAVGDDPFLAGNPANLDIGIRTNGPNPGIFEPLTRLSPTFGVEAALALRWESPSPKVWRFFLRRDVTFHNGAPFNAEAVVSTLDGIARRATHPRGLDPGTARATADDVVEINLTADNTRLPEQLASPSMAVIAPGTRPGGGDTPETTPTGTGPFVFVSYSKGAELKMKGNEKYWAGPTELRSLTFRFGPERDVSRLLATRQVEIAGMVGYKNLASVSGRTDRNVQSRPGQAAYLLLNTGGINEWTTLKDDSLRKALAQTIDRNEFTKAAYEGHGEDSDTLIPEVVLGTDAADRIHPPPLNRNEAKKTLDGAGWLPTLPNGMRAKDGKPLVLNLLLSRPSDQDKAAEALKAQLADVGVGLQVQDPGSDTPFTLVNNATFDLFLDVRPQDDANPCALCRFFTIRPGGQLSFSASVGGGPKVDEAYDRLFSSPSIDTARRTAADIMQVVTAERVTAISLASLRTEWLISPRVRGFEPAVLAGAQQWESVFLTV